MQAPHTLIQTTCIFPNPQLGDTLASQDQMQMRMAMDGSLYTFVKTNDRISLVLTFDLVKAKAIELREFYRAYSDQPIRLTLWDNSLWIVYFTNDQADFEHLGRTPSSIIQVVLEGSKIG